MPIIGVALEEIHESSGENTWFVLAAQIKTLTSRWGKWKVTESRHFFAMPSLFDELSMKTSQKSNLETDEFIYIIDE